MTEAAVVMPLLVLMLFSVFYFGQAFVDSSNAVTAARYRAWREGRGDTINLNDNSVAEKFFPGHEGNMSYSDDSAEFQDLYDGLDDPIGFLFTLLDWVSDTEIGTVTYRLQPMGVDMERLGFGAMNTAVNVRGYHCVDMDPWPEDSAIDYGIRIAIWGYAYANRNKSGESGEENADVDNSGISIDIGVPGLDIGFP